MLTAAHARTASIEKLVWKKVYKAFALHDGPTKEGGGGSRRPGTRTALYASWAEFKNKWRLVPIADVTAYLGARLGCYFLWWVHVSGCRAVA